MQRNFFLIFTILMVALCVGGGFAGCSEDSLDSLKGTTWVCADSEEDGLFVTITLEFKSEEKGVQTWKIDGKQKESSHFDFIYTYEHPNVSIDYGYIMSGVISGNKMTFTENKETTVFKRK